MNVTRRKISRNEIRSYIHAWILWTHIGWLRFAENYIYIYLFSYFNMFLSSYVKVAIKSFAFPIHSYLCLKSLVTVAFICCITQYVYVQFKWVPLLLIITYPDISPISPSITSFYSLSLLSFPWLCIHSLYLTHSIFLHTFPPLTLPSSSFTDKKY
jgi:hypothetical protein